MLEAKLDLLEWEYAAYAAAAFGRCEVDGPTAVFCADPNAVFRGELAGCRLLLRSKKRPPPWPGSRTSRLPRVLLERLRGLLKPRLNVLNGHPGLISMAPFTAKKNGSATDPICDGSSRRSARCAFRPEQ